tara:strand:- start:296 stop:736 length:441 start_codon:yes stop_codon:yes gene_type:complete
VDATYSAVKSGRQMDKESLAWLVSKGCPDACGGRLRDGDSACNLFITLEVMDGTHSGKKIREWHLFWHPSITAMDIGRGMVEQLSIACGATSWDSPKELIGSEVFVHTRIERDDRYGDKVKVKVYEASGSSPASGAAPFNDQDIPF